MPRTNPPVIYVIAGPNGAGKTTFARKFLPAANVVEFLNPDLLAAGLSPLRPELMAAQAARLLLNRWKELFAARRNFAFESTLSGRSYAFLIRRARGAGYTVRMAYLWLPAPELCLRRIDRRVRMGGHNVPEKDVRRRFLPSLRNFFSLYVPLADEAVLFQANVSPPQVIARWDKADLVLVDAESYEVVKEQVGYRKNS